MKKEDLVINQTHTSCKNCVFAKYQNNEQIGCTLNKLDDYRNAGVNVIDVYDEEKKFHIIDGRFCLFYRNKELMQNYPRSTWEDIVKLQTKVPYQMMVIVDKDTTFSELKKTLMGLKAQEVPPSMVTIINKQYPYYLEDSSKYIKPSLLLECLENSEFHQYELRNVYDKTLDDRILIDLVFDYTKSEPFPIYTVFKAGFNIPRGFSKEMNDAILIKMLQICFVRPIDGINGMIVNKIAHKKHSGNSFGINLEEKILKYEDNGAKFIFEMEEVCPSLVS